MKKVIALLLALMMCLTLCACGGTGNGGTDNGGMDNYRSNIARTPEEVIKNYASMRTFEDYCCLFGIDAVETLKNHYTAYLYQNTDGSLEKMREELLGGFPNNLIRVPFIDSSNISADVLIDGDKVESYRSGLEQASSFGELLSTCVEATIEFWSADFETMMEEQGLNFSVLDVSTRELSGDEYTQALGEYCSYIKNCFVISQYTDVIFMVTPESINRIYSVSGTVDFGEETRYYENMCVVVETADGCFTMPY
ncbi:MAG: hypothetical protein Q4A83_08410 [Bacillota bacterium]|nr:hypothetical protein [Bacillota bacterium]